MKLPSYASLAATRRRLERAVCLAIACVGIMASAFAGPSSTNQFPIMAWGPTPHNPAVFKKMREAGFTIAGFVSPDMLNACQAAGLKAIVEDRRASDYDWRHLDTARARENIRSLASQVGDNPAVIGYDLYDEPSTKIFGGLATVSSLIKELSPGKLPYIDLLPIYANKQQLGADSYPEYLEKFISTCHPPLVTYDNYALMDDGSVRQSYWPNLEAVRAACKRHHLNFWNIVLSVGHFNYALPSAAGLRFQVYTTLAYGGRGISYFTYFAPKVGNYRMAPVDQFGNETPTWYLIQNVNLQVQKLAPTLLKLRSDEVYHFGHIPAGCHGPLTNSLVTKMNGDFLVGDFTHEDGTRYVLIVNKDIHHSQVCAPTFRREAQEVRMISPYTGTLRPFVGEQKWLAPGAGVLLKLIQ